MCGEGDEAKFPASQCLITSALLVACIVSITVLEEATMVFRGVQYESSGPMASVCPLSSTVGVANHPPYSCSQKQGLPHSQSRELRSLSPCGLEYTASWDTMPRYPHCPSQVCPPWTIPCGSTVRPVLSGVGPSEHCFFLSTWTALWIVL